MSQSRMWETAKSDGSITTDSMRDPESPQKTPRPKPTMPQTSTISSIIPFVCHSPVPIVMSRITPQRHCQSFMPHSIRSIYSSHSFLLTQSSNQHLDTGSHKFAIPQQLLTPCSPTQWHSCSGPPPRPFPATTPPPAPWKPQDATPFPSPTLPRSASLHAP